MARPSLALALLMALALAPERPARADDALVKQFAAEYREKLPTLIERYVKNRKVQTVVREYRTSNPFPGEPIGSKTAEYTVTAVSDGTNFRIESKNASPQPYDRGLWVILRPNDRVDVSQNKDRTGYVVTEHRPTSTHPLRVDKAQVLSGMFLPLLSATTSPIPLLLHEIETQNDSSPQRWDITTITSTTWGGHRVKAVRVRLDQLQGQNISYYTLYLDLDHMLIHRGAEGEGKSQDGQPWKISTEVTYVSSPDGYLIPSKYANYRMMPNGSKIPSRIVEVKEYSRYTPLPDEFTLAQFGLAEPALDAPVRTPRRRYIWIFVAAGVVFALVAGALYWRWRSPRQSPTPTRSRV